MSARVLLLLALTATATGQEWDRFRGPGGGGLYTGDAALPTSFGPEHNVLWKTPLPSGYSSPCVHGARVFVTAHEGQQLLTLCLARETGQVLWRKAVEQTKPERRVHENNGPASATPTSDGERVYVYFGSFGLVCYDVDGAEQWRRALPPPQNTFGSAASPIAQAGRLVFVHDDNDASYLELIDGASGETVWRKERAGFKSGWSTPTVSGDELLVYGVGWLSAYALADGEERWSVPGLTDEPIITPTVANGLVYVTSYNMNSNPEVHGLPTFAALLKDLDDDGNGTLNAEEARDNKSILSRFDADGEGDHPLSIFFRFLDGDRDGEITADEWPKVERWLASMQHANALFALRPGKGDQEPEIVWQFERGVPECPSPLVHDGRVYTVKNGGIVTCLDAATGALHFEGRLDQRGPCYASPVAGDGKIYSASARGQVTVFAAGDELEVLARNDLGERILATPALVDGAVLVRTEGHLYAFGAAR